MTFPLSISYTDSRLIPQPRSKQMSQPLLIQETLLKLLRSQIATVK